MAYCGLNQILWLPVDLMQCRIAVARAGNVLIGGDLYSSRRTQGAGRLFVDCFEALAEGRAPEVFCPSFTRPYTYGKEALQPTNPGATA